MTVPRRGGWAQNYIMEHSSPTVEQSQNYALVLMGGAAPPPVEHVAATKYLNGRFRIVVKVECCRFHSMANP